MSTIAMAMFFRFARSATILVKHVLVQDLINAHHVVPITFVGLFTTESQVWEGVIVLQDLRIQMVYVCKDVP